uniref:Uncharacterized protein n=1 Tax=Romanomermis culicivorax TaxID=13658 RepID=A0A915L3Z7_ROMCU
MSASIICNQECLLLGYAHDLRNLEIEFDSKLYNFTLWKNAEHNIIDPHFDVFHSFSGRKFKFNRNFHKHAWRCSYYEGRDAKNLAKLEISKCGEELTHFNKKDIGKYKSYRKKTVHHDQMIIQINSDHHVIKLLTMGSDRYLGDKFLTNVFADIINSDNDNNDDSFMLSIRGPLVVELALFVDEELWKKFEKKYDNDALLAEQELNKFVFSVLNNVNLIYKQDSMDPKVIFKLKRYEIMKTSPTPFKLVLQGPAHDNGDVDKLLTNFCEYQRGLNARSDDDPRHWDHAVLLTG